MSRSFQGERPQVEGVEGQHCAAKLQGINHIRLLQRSSNAYCILSSRPRSKYGCNWDQTSALSPGVRHNSIRASSKSTSSLQAASFIANSWILASPCAKMPASSYKMLPGVIRVTNPFAPSLSQSSGRPSLFATLAAQRRMSAASDCRKGIMSMSFVERLESISNAMAAPPTTRHSTRFPSLYATEPSSRKFSRMALASKNISLSR